MSVRQLKENKITKDGRSWVFIQYSKGLDGKRHQYQSQAYMTEEEAIAFAETIADCKKKIRFCKICGNYTDKDICDICSTRQNDLICVVKEPKDVIALKKAKLIPNE